MVRRPTSRSRTGRLNTNLTRANSPSVTLGSRLRDLSGMRDLSDADRKRLERMLDLAGDLRDVDPDDLVIIRNPIDVRDRIRDFDGSVVKPKVLSDLVHDALKRPGLPKDNKLDFITGSVMDLLREKTPKALPRKPVPTGKKGADLPVTTSALTQLLRLAAMQLSDNEASVIWDDGVNQLVVHLKRMKAVVTEGRVRIEIPVEADGLRTTMKVPFSVGSEKRVSGLVMATADRPAGNALVARIWGEPLIALAHSALLRASESLAGASGRDVQNKRLIPRALVARRGSFTVESQARFVFKGDLQ